MIWGGAKAWMTPSQPLKAYFGRRVMMTRNFAGITSSRSAGIAKLFAAAFQARLIGRSRRHFGGVIGPEAECIVARVAV